MTSPRPHRDSSLIWATVIASFALSLYGIIAVADQPLVQRPDLGDARATFSAVHQLAQAKVTIVRSDRSTPCSWNLQIDRHVCGSENWNFVGVYNGRAAGGAQRCIWVHPGPDGAVTQIRWHDVELGATASATLMLLEGSGPGDTVNMELKVDDEIVVGLQATGDREVHNKQALLSPGRDRGSITIEISAQDNRWRLACIRLVLQGNRSEIAQTNNETVPGHQAHRQRAGRVR
jgi:hypothetical protein